MGRWGWRLFEGDADLDIICDIDTVFEEGDEEIHLVRMVNQTDMMAPPPARDFYKSKNYIPILEDLIQECRVKLDSGRGNRLFERYRSKERETGVLMDGKYRLILVGALMMRAGAKIRPADLDYLRALVPGIPSRGCYAMSMFDDGFRDPGKMQFLTALDNYKPGVPRNFATPSCFKCGKIDADIGKPLMKCSRCQMSFYCDKDCQKKNWKMHKQSCIPWKTRTLQNV